MFSSPKRRRSATINKRLVAVLSFDNQNCIIKTWSCKTVSGVVRKYYRPKVDWRPIYNSHYQPCDKGQGRCVVRFPKTNVHRSLAAKNGCADAALYKRQQNSRRESRHSRTRAEVGKMDYRIFAVFIIALVLIVAFVIRRTVKKKRKDEKGRIYKTTDGYLADNPKNKKKRNVVVVEQRKKDGAIAVSKIFGADEKSGDFYIDDLELKPSEHSSLTKNSLVERRVKFGVKRNGNHTPIYIRDLKPTNDKLTKKEMRKVNKQKGGKTQQNRKTYRNTRRQWKQGFKKKSK